MTRRRLPFAACGVALLVALVALVANGRPLAAATSRTGRGGLPQSFWDFAFTSVVVVAVLLFLIVIVALFVDRPEMELPPASRVRGWRAFLILIGIAGVALFLGWHFRFQNPGVHERIGPPTSDRGLPKRHHLPSGYHPQFRWEEVVIVAALVILVAAVYAVTRPKRQPREFLLGTAPETVAAALDESLDDLRTDTDLRRAIIAAYARMEKTLAAVGTPRAPAEAPLEYVERALLALHTSGAAVRRLTDLFEWARFSHHEPDAGMRDEAVNALEAVRDELRAPAEIAA